MASIKTAFISDLSKNAGSTVAAHDRRPSARVPFVRDGFGNLPYSVQQHMVQNTMRLHQMQQVQPQQFQHFWGMQQPQPVVQQGYQYEMPHAFVQQQQQMPTRRFQNFQQPVQQPARQFVQQQNRRHYERPVVQQHARHQQPTQRVQQQRVLPQLSQQQLQQQQFQFQQLQLQQQARNPQQHVQPHNQHLPQQQPYQRQMSVGGPQEYPGQRMANVGHLSPTQPHGPAPMQAQAQAQAHSQWVTQWVMQQQNLQQQEQQQQLQMQMQPQQQQQQQPIAAPVVSTATTQQIFNGVAAPASIRSEAVATNAIKQLLGGNGVGALITPNFAEMSNGPSNGPKRLDIDTPSQDHRIRAYQLLTGANLPIVLGNGDRATVRAIGATDLVQGRPANIDLEVLRDDGRSRRLYVALTSGAPTPVQTAPVQADPTRARAQNRQVHFNA